MTENTTTTTTVNPVAGITQLMTVADVAAALSITGQAVSAYHKNSALDTPKPAFFITTAHARRKFELLWTADQLPQWQTAVDNVIVAEREAILAKAVKAEENAVKARERAEAAQARIAGLTASPSVDEVEAHLNGDSDEPVVADGVTIPVAPEGASEDFESVSEPEGELVDATPSRGRGRRK
jgi:hypothetical protein